MIQTPTSGMVERYAPMYALPVPYERFHRLLEIACYYQNRCCDLEEIVAMFCEDAIAEVKP